MSKLMLIDRSVAMEESARLNAELKDSSKITKALNNIHRNCTDTLKLLSILNDRYRLNIGITLLAAIAVIVHRYGFNQEPVYPSILLIAFLALAVWIRGTGLDSQMKMLSSIDDIELRSAASLPELEQSTSEQVTVLHGKIKALSQLAAGQILFVLIITIWVILPHALQ